ILLTNGSEHFIGPDNGIFSLILEDPLSKRPSADGFRAYELNKPQWYKETPGEKTPAGHEASASFHARDIFGPIAARLSLGIDAAHLGSEIDCAALAALPVLEQSWRSDSIRVGRVMHVDRFGNLITSLPAQEAAAGVFYIGTTRIGALVKTYHSVKPGQLLAFIGSHGFVEVAVCEGNAQRVLGATSNTTVELRAQ